ncbi:MAG TPA: DMT family transporter [Acidiphilium sp.]
MSEIARLPSRSMRLPLPVLVLIFVTMLWGVTFIVTRISLHFVGPYGFVGLRFALAAIAVALVARPHPASFRRAELIGGIGIGVILFFGYGLQADGLRTVASGESAFLTALYVPMVPVLEWLLFRRRPGVATFAALILAFAGLVLMSGMTPAHLELGTGAILTLAGALATSFEIVLIGRFSAHTDPRRIALIQLATVSVLSLAVAGVSGERILTTAPFALGGIIGLGLMTAFIMVAMNWAQRSVPANRATLIYAMEPVWAGVIGAIFGEIFAPAQLIGGAMIVGSVVLSQWRNAR